MTKEPAHRSTHCQNCGHPLTGRYCAACGQKDEERILPLKELLHEVFHDLLHLDARFLRTLKMLIRPGALTREYVEGRRVRWFPPFRLYLIVSLVFFAAVSLRGPSTLKIQILSTAQVQTAAPEGQTGSAKPGVIARMEQNAQMASRDPSKFRARVLSWLPRVFFVLLPLFALLLKLAYLRSRMLYAVHAIFSLHEHAFAFLAFTVVELLTHVPHTGALRILLLLALPVHFTFGLKRIYDQRWPVTIFKAAAVGLAHLGLILIGMSLTAVGLLLTSS